MRVGVAVAVGVGVGTGDGVGVEVGIGVGVNLGRGVGVRVCKILSAADSVGVEMSAPVGAGVGGEGVTLGNTVLVTTSKYSNNSTSSQYSLPPVVSPVVGSIDTQVLPSLTCTLMWFRPLSTTHKAGFRESTDSLICTELPGSSIHGNDGKARSSDRGVGVAVGVDERCGDGVGDTSTDGRGFGVDMREEAFESTGGNARVGSLMGALSVVELAVVACDCGVDVDSGVGTDVPALTQPTIATAQAIITATICLEANPTFTHSLAG